MSFPWLVRADPLAMTVSRVRSRAATRVAVASPVLGWLLMVNPPGWGSGSLITEVPTGNSTRPVRSNPGKKDGLERTFAVLLVAYDQLATLGIRTTPVRCTTPRTGPGSEFSARGIRDIRSVGDPHEA